MTYEGNAHNTEESNRQHAAALRAEIRERQQIREARKRARRRENIEDALTAFVIALVCLLIGWRAHAVYGVDEPTPARCFDDEVSASFAKEGFGFEEGTTFCVPFDDLDMEGD